LLQDILDQMIILQADPAAQSFYQGGKLMQLFLNLKYSVSLRYTSFPHIA